MAIEDSVLEDLISLGADPDPHFRVTLFRVFSTLDLAATPVNPLQQLLLDTVLAGLPTTPIGKALESNGSHDRGLGCPEGAVATCQLLRRLGRSIGGAALSASPRASARLAALGSLLRGREGGSGMYRVETLPWRTAGLLAFVDGAELREDQQHDPMHIQTVLQTVLGGGGGGGGGGRGSGGDIGGGQIGESAGNDGGRGILRSAKEWFPLLFQDTGEVRGAVAMENEASTTTMEQVQEQGMGTNTIEGQHGVAASSVTVKCDTTRGLAQRAVAHAFRDDVCRSVSNGSFLGGTEESMKTLAAIRTSLQSASALLPFTQGSDSSGAGLIPCGREDEYSSSGIDSFCGMYVKAASVLLDLHVAVAEAAEELNDGSAVGCGEHGTRSGGSGGYSPNSPELVKGGGCRDQRHGESIVGILAAELLRLTVTLLYGFTGVDSHTILQLQRLRRAVATAQATVHGREEVGGKTAEEVRGGEDNGRKRRRTTVDLFWPGVPLALECSSAGADEGGGGAKRVGARLIHPDACAGGSEATVVHRVPSLPAIIPVTIELYNVPPSCAVRVCIQVRIGSGEGGGGGGGGGGGPLRSDLGALQLAGMHSAARDACPCTLHAHGVPVAST